MIVIRLKRIGMKHHPCYRVAVADSRRSVLGKSIEIIGHYSPFKDKKVFIQNDRYDYWLKKGAQPSQTVKNLYKKLQ